MIKPVSLANLVGLRLMTAAYAADMRGFGFGKQGEEAPEERGQWWLHIQCPWRIESRDAVITGSLDWYELADPDADRDPEWDPAHGGSLQEARLRGLFQDYNESERVIHDMTGLLVVDNVEVTAYGDVLLEFTNDLRLRVFASGTRGEFWRVFEKGNPDSHFVFEL